MANFTFGEILTIVVVILIVFGPKRLPEMARKAGAFVSKARAAALAMRDEFTTEYRDAIEPLQEAREEIRATGRELKSDATSIQADLKAVGDETRREMEKLERETQGETEDPPAGTSEETAPDENLPVEGNGSTPVAVDGDENAPVARIEPAPVDDGAGGDEDRGEAAAAEETA